MSSDDIDNGQEHKVMEFDFPLPANKLGPNSNFVKRHSELAEFFELKGNEQLHHIFSTAAGLCDPFTQPEENEDTILSVDCLADLLIAISYSNLKYVKVHDQFILNEEDDNSDTDGDESDTQSIFSDDDKDIVESPDINCTKFHLSTQFLTVLQIINQGLQASSELHSRYVENDETHWLENLSVWTPLPPIADDKSKLRLCYAMTCILFVAIYKLFKPESGEYNLALNPYLHYFITSWKIHSNIIILGLEIDRRLENENDERGTFLETPDIVKQTLRGSSSVRTVLAWILNQNPSSLYLPDYSPTDSLKPDHDIKEESLLDFSHPLIRKNLNGGALSIDMRHVIIALLIINSGSGFAGGHLYSEAQLSFFTNEDERNRRRDQSLPIAELGDLLIDLEYDDKFDEDIRYIFGYEYFDSEEEDGMDENGADSDSAEDDADGSTVLEEDGAFEKSEVDKNPISIAIRSLDESNSLRFDEQGRDWRDMPREANLIHEDWFLEILGKFDRLSKSEQHSSDDFLPVWSELLGTFEFLKTNDISDDIEAEMRVGQVVINTIARAIRDEDENSKKAQSSNPNDSIDPDMIYAYWTSAASKEDIAITSERKRLLPLFTITNFELLLLNNQKLARCLLDQMFMCKGYRRVLIWFLTHNINLSASLIDYVFEVLTGLRGNPDRMQPYRFTRKGNALFLSEVEKSMLLHEFLTTCSGYLTAIEGVEEDLDLVLSDTIAKKIMTVLCLMIDRLISQGVISFDKDKNDDLHDYSNELQVLLINWVGKLPEARKLYFYIKDKTFKRQSDDELDQKIGDHARELTDSLEHDNASLSKAVEEISSLPSWSMNQRIRDDRKLFAQLDSFIKRLECHLKSLISFERNELGFLPESLCSSEVNVINADFKFFLENFNTLCKIEYVAETLFFIFEKVVDTGEIVESTLKFGVDTLDIDSNSQINEQPAVSKQSQVGSETPDAEFNDQFLNGEGGFSEKKVEVSEQESKSKRKKKKKKSKKGK